MRLSNRNFLSRRPSLEISMTSMIDVVFLLLIFFLVTTTFIKPEQQLNSAIKVERTDAGIQQKDLEPAVLDLFVIKDRVIFQLGARQTTDLNELKRVVESFANKDDGAFVRVSGDVAFDHAAQAIGMFKSCGFKNVSYLPVD